MRTCLSRKVHKGEGGTSMKAEFLDTTDHMEYGHEGWLEPNTTHVHEGDPVEIYFKWGHNMQAHDLPEKKVCPPMCFCLTDKSSNWRYRIVNQAAI